MLISLYTLACSFWIIHTLSSTRTSATEEFQPQLGMNVYVDLLPG